MKSIHVLLVPLIFLAGCGVTLEASKVVPTDAGIKAGFAAPTQVKGNGIVYALPRTEFEVVQPIKLKFSTAGGLSETYLGCKRACDADNKNVGDACDLTTAADVLYAPPELRTASVPDYTRLYQITPSTDLFQSMTFKFEIASNGVVDKVDATATNTGFEVVTSAASAALKIAFAAAPATRADREAKSRYVDKTKKRSCYQTSVDISGLLKNETSKLSCELAQEISACLTSYEDDVKEKQKDIDDIFDRAQKGTLKADLVAALAGNRRDRLTAATQRRDEAAALFGLADGKNIEAVYQAILPMGGPNEYQSFTGEATLGPTVTSGKTRIVAMSDNAGSYLRKLLVPLKASTLHYVVESIMPNTFYLEKSDETESLGKGYRYRVPVSAPASLTVFKDSSKAAFDFGPSINKMIVAQYGPVAALPSKFKGKSGHILVKHWPDSGGLQTVEIGSEAIPSTAVTDVIGTAADQIKAKRDKTAATDPELDALTRKQKLLDLQKQIKDLEAELAKTGSN